MKRYFRLAVLSIGVLHWLMLPTYQQNIISDAIEFLRRGQYDFDLENYDNAKMFEQYDFIVVGAGTAGCTLAARLSENPAWNVLLLEAGGPETLIMDIPIVAHFLQLGQMNWKYRTQPSSGACLAMNDNRCNWPRGKVMGGSSVLNYMMYTRGNRRDYDRWAELGNVGWSYKDVLPYFKKYEGSNVPDADPDYVGRAGPVKVSYAKWRSKISDAFVQAAQQDGLSHCDYNGKIQTCVSYLQTTTGDSIRWSSNRAYLYALKGKRANLHIRKHALVTKILIDPKTKTATSVYFNITDQAFKIRANREILVAAGAINTPQLLMLSGIGPAAHLQNLGIPVIADLKVGFNLQDHIAPPLFFTADVPSLHYTDFFNITLMQQFIRGRTGPYVLPGGCEAIAFWDLEHEKLTDGWPDIELFLVGGLFQENPAVIRASGLNRTICDRYFRSIDRNTANGFVIFPMIMRPRSRGRILLKSKDPLKYPLIYPKYFNDPYDIDILVRGILKAVSLMDMPAFRQINAKLWQRKFPPCSEHLFMSWKYWECYARHFTFTIYHYSGTTKMGPVNDSSAVVDPRLRVHGIRNLRVVDASIMPELITGHPNGPVFMIAEKAADMIKHDHGYEEQG